MKGKKMRKVVVILALVAMLPASAWAFGNQGGGRRQEPPAEAIEACEDKSVGDTVELTGRRGQTEKMTCQERDGQLVAVPEGR